MGGSLDEIQRRLDGIRVPRIDIPISFDIPSMDIPRPEINVPVNYNYGGGEDRAIHAQGGGQWDVKSPVQPFVAHRGETVTVSKGGSGTEAKLLRELIAAVKEKGGDLVYAPQISTLDGPDVARVTEEKLLPEFIRIIQDKADKKKEFREAID